MNSFPVYRTASFFKAEQLTDYDWTFNNYFTVLECSKLHYITSKKACTLLGWPLTRGSNGTNNRSVVMPSRLY